MEKRGEANSAEWSRSLRPSSMTTSPLQSLLSRLEEVACPS